MPPISWANSSSNNKASLDFPEAFLQAWTDPLGVVQEAVLEEGRDQA